MFYLPISTLLSGPPAELFIRISVMGVLLFAGVMFFSLMYKRGKFSKRTAVFGFAGWFYLLAVLFVTVISRTTADFHEARTVLFASYKEFEAAGNPDWLIDIVINLLMFVPFSFLCAGFVDSISGEEDSFIKPAVIALIAGVTFTLTIECVQLVTRMGTFDVDDIFHNTIGTMLGIALWTIWNKVSKKRHGGIT